MPQRVRLSEWLGHTPSELHSPVRFPSSAAVRRERLLPGCRVHRLLDPAEAHLDRLVVERVARVERSDTIAKAANDWHIQIVWRSSIQPPNRPFSGNWVIGPNRCCSDLTCGEVQDVVFEIAKATKNLSCTGPTFELCPRSTPTQAFIKPPMADCPVANDEIEIGRRLLFS
jgi:hypothetical protein